MPILIDDKSLQALRRKRRAKRLRTAKPSAKVERELMRSMNDLWMRVLFPASARIKGMVQAGASPAEIAEVIEQALRQAEFEYGLAADDIVAKWKLSLDTETRRKFTQGLQSSLGVDVTALYDDPVVGNALALGGLEASNLIRTIPRQYLGEVAKAVADNFTGQPLPEKRSLQQQIQHLGGVTERRAKIIARDQTSKLTSVLAQTRQQSIGVDEYIWRTVRDQRVVGNPAGKFPEGSSKHGNHYKMDGVHCRWDDPTVYSKDGGKTWIKREGDMPKNHPGHDILCRCNAEAVVDIKKILKFAKIS